MTAPDELKIVCNERALVTQSIENQDGAPRVLVMLSSPDWGTLPTTLDRDEAYQLWQWLGRWLDIP